MYRPTAELRRWTFSVNAFIALSSVPGQGFDQRCADAFAAATFDDRHRELGQRLVVCVDEQRRIVDVPPSGPDELPIVIHGDNRDVAAPGNRATTAEASALPTLPPCMEWRSAGSPAAPLQAGDCESGGHERETRHGRSARPRSAYARAGPREAWPRRMLLAHSGSRVPHLPRCTNSATMKAA